MIKDPKLVRQELFRAMMVVLGAAIYSLAVEMFYITADLTTGGLTGIALILRKIIPLPTGTMVLVMNIPLFALGYKHMGRHFFFTSILGMVISSLAMDLFAAILEPIPALVEDRLLCSVLGGAVNGVGMGIVMGAGGSTGGKDIIGVLLSKRQTGLSLGRIFLLLDAVIVAANTIIFRDVAAALYTAIAMYLSAIVTDSIMYGADVASVVMIVTQRRDEIAELLTRQIRRGATILTGVGAYTGNEQSVLFCAINRRQLAQLKRLVRVCDPNAFVIVTEAKEVLGNGFRNEES